MYDVEVSVFYVRKRYLAAADAGQARRRRRRREVICWGMIGSLMDFDIF